MYRTPRCALPLLRLIPVLVALASCGRSASGASIAGTDATPLLHLLHPNTPIVAHYDFDGLRRSPYYDALRELTRSIESEHRELIDGFFGMAERTDHMVIGTASLGAEQPLMAVRGAFEGEQLQTVLGFDEAAAYRNRELHGRGYGWLALPDARTAILGHLQEVHDALDRFDGIFPGTGPTRPGFTEAAALAQLGERDVSMVWVITDDMRAELGQGHIEHVLYENGVSAGGWLSVRDGLQLEGFVTANDAAAIPVLAHALREALAEGAGDPMVAALGAADLLQQVTLHEEGTTFRVTLSATDAQVRTLLANTLQLVQRAQ